MKHSVWTDEDILFLKNNHYFKNNREIAKILDKSFDSVARKINKLELKKEKAILVENKITSSDANVIYLILKKFSNKELSEMSGYSIPAITKMKSAIKKAKENIKIHHNTISIIERLKAMECENELVLENIDSLYRNSINTHINRVFGKNKFSIKKNKNTIIISKKS